jgi:hypothetical protein
VAKNSTLLLLSFQMPSIPGKVEMEYKGRWGIGQMEGIVGTIRVRNWPIGGKEQKNNRK